MTINQKTILIADDEPHLTYMLAHKLRAAGFEVLTVDNGGQALAMAAAHCPAVIITDYQMPVMNGLEMCLRLRQSPATAHIPAIMLTARGHRLSPDDLSRAGIRTLLMKPFSLREILERVNELLGQIELGTPFAATPANGDPRGDVTITRAGTP